MIHRGIKSFTEGVKKVAEVLDDSQRGQIIHRGIKEFTEAVK